MSVWNFLLVTPAVASRHFLRSLRKGACLLIPVKNARAYIFSSEHAMGSLAHSMKTDQRTMMRWNWCLSKERSVLRYWQTQESCSSSLSRARFVDNVLWRKADAQTFWTVQPRTRSNHNRFTERKNAISSHVEMKIRRAMIQFMIMNEVLSLIVERTKHILRQGEAKVNTKRNQRGNEQKWTSNGREFNKGRGSKTLWTR